MNNPPGYFAFPAPGRWCDSGRGKALNVGPSGIEVAYERLGDAGALPVPLMRGGGAQMINWPGGSAPNWPAAAWLVTSRRCPTHCRTWRPRYPAWGRRRRTGRTSSTGRSGAFRAVGSPGFEFDEHAVADRAGRCCGRDDGRLGVLRQSAAVLGSGDRTARLRSLRVPTLVLRGADDVRVRRERRAGHRRGHPPAPSWRSSRAWATACPDRYGPSSPPASPDSSSALKPSPPQRVTV